MPVHMKHEPDALVITFERDGEEPETLMAANGRQALTHAVGLIVTHRELQAGDRLTVTAADEPHRQS